MSILTSLQSKPHVLGAVVDLGAGVTQGRFALHIAFNSAEDAEAFRKAVIEEVSGTKVQTADESAAAAGAAPALGEEDLTKGGA